YEIIGIAQEQVRLVSSTTTGKLKLLNASIHQTVDKGDLLASIDGRLLRIALEGANAEVKKLQGELAMTEDQLLVEAINTETEAETTRRQFAMDIERYHLKVLELRTELEPAIIELKDLKLEIAIEKDLFERGAVTTDYAIQKAQVSYNILAKKVEETGNMLTEATTAWENTKSRQAGFSEHQTAHYSVEKALLPIKQAIKVQEKVIEGLQLQGQALMLTAPVSGIVSTIQRRPGETVLAGEPILTITEPVPSGIVGYLNDMQADSVKPGDTVVLIKNGSSPRMQEAMVISVGPGVEEKPVRYWKIPDVPEWGRPMLIELPSGFEAIPGQAVGVKVL
ncbi:MAG: HlyD family efflux transporter periplasmic adaptor subunit, partial [Anaerohalosphaera sp.]|nr:HlyD family efflux transporter periplasmic adaptor subunit [Anaerohalosphaera sp.]